MLDDVREQVTRYLSNIEFRAAPEEVPPPQPFEMHETRRDPALDMEPGFIQSSQTGQAAFAPGGSQGAMIIDDQEDVPQVARNAPCPCGSGKKYKHCHGSAV